MHSPCGSAFGRFVHPVVSHVAWDMPALETCPVKGLGQARSWDMPFNMLGAGPLLGHALQMEYVKCPGCNREAEMPWQSPDWSIGATSSVILTLNT